VSRKPPLATAHLRVARPTDDLDAVNYHYSKCVLYDRVPPKKRGSVTLHLNLT
jgi:hypothetical protein